MAFSVSIFSEVFGMYLQGRKWLPKTGGGLGVSSNASGKALLLEFKKTNCTLLCPKYFTFYIILLQFTEI